MKTYVLMISKYFPKKHYRSGQETNFQDKIISGEKKHTLRSNYALWEKRISEIQKGNAVLSIRQWEGKPYRSKQLEIACLSNNDNVGIERMSLPSMGNLAVVFKVYPDMDTNDGLSRLDWMNWFEHYERNKPMAIIHFSDFRYGNLCNNNLI